MKEKQTLRKINFAVGGQWNMIVHDKSKAYIAEQINETAQTFPAL